MEHGRLKGKSMDSVRDIIAAGCIATAQQGAMQAGLPRNALDALEAMRPHHRYRLDRFAHPEGALKLIDLGLALDISSHYAGAIRGATLNTAGEILRGAIHGTDD